MIEQSAELQTWAFVKIYSLEKYKSLKRYLSVICCINRYQWGREYAPFYFKGLPLNLEIRIFLILRRTPESWFIALLYSFCVKSVILLVLKFLLLRNVWKSCGPGLCKINFCICPNRIGENPVLMLSVPQSSHSKMFLSFDISLVSDTAHVYVWMGCYNELEYSFSCGFWGRKMGFSEQGFLHLYWKLFYWRLYCWDYFVLKFCYSSSVTRFLKTTQTDETYEFLLDEKILGIIPSQVSTNHCLMLLHKGEGVPTLLLQWAAAGLSPLPTSDISHFYFSENCSFS